MVQCCGGGIRVSALNVLQTSGTLATTKTSLGM